MGAFYDSVQIHSDDHEAVRTLLEELVPKKKRSFLLGPVLNGWIGVYPNRDVAAVRDLARRLRVELLSLNVHDDDTFFYEYYRNGKRVDRYNSAPDYFEEVSDTACAPHSQSILPPSAMPVLEPAPQTAGLRG